MNEYRVKGLTCANCTRELQDQIQKLEHGENANLSYNTGKLTVDPNVSLSDIRRVLKSEGAFIEENNHDNEEEGHSHSHGHLNHFNAKRLLLIAAAVFGITVLFDGKLPLSVVIAMDLFSMAISGYPTFIKGIKNLFRFKFNIDTLMTIASYWRCRHWGVEGSDACCLTVWFKRMVRRTWYGESASIHGNPVSSST